MRFIGPKYTWMTKWGISEEIWVRLDRALCSMDWRLRFGEGFIRHLPRVNSDHCHILLHLHSSQIPSGFRKPFRFEAIWLRHKSFPEVVKSNWNLQKSNVTKKVHDLTEVLKVWNKEQFGNLFRNKKRILTILQGVQNCLSGKYIASLDALEDKLMKEYNCIIDQEKLIWMQKSRNCWPKDGDRNIKFFHLSTLVKRRRNKLEGIKREDGSWTTNKEEMKHMAVRYFRNLFAANDNDCMYDLLPLMFPTISEDNSISLNCSVSEDEVHHSLFNIGSLKTPGPDGFPAIFFQQLWNVCKDDLVKLVADSFKNGCVPSDINQTLITLVSKIESPMDMSHLRPISLCNTTYKIISKIIVQRLKHLLFDLISPNQVVFVLGRQIQDNIVVALEVLQKLKTVKGKRGYFDWKIDLAKTYDNMQCSFTRKVLVEAGIEGNFGNLIMSCITSVHYKIVMNGETIESFFPSSGIRQGNPLSPYIFVLCMEKLSHLINLKLKEGDWKAIKVSRRGSEISHLLFADDLILFGKATVRQAEIKKECIDIFCVVSSQHVSFTRSRVFCSRNTKDSIAKEIDAVCDSPLTKNSGKYLGVPLINGRVTNETNKEIVENTQKRLASWKSVTLSLASRITLIKAVTTSLPVYAMQLVKLPSRHHSGPDNIIWGLSKSGEFTVKSAYEAHFQGVGSVLEADLWGLFEGLKFVWETGFRKVEVESDSKVIVELLLKKIDLKHPIFSLINSYKKMIDSDWCCKVCHVYRESNRLVDCLASLGHYLNPGIVFFENPPPKVLATFEDDVNGLAQARQVKRAIDKLDSTRP
ncbi:hypothetical protein Dsin_015734 [Dipteronia sinensis]|uniref:Reverse transcriptase domain-containing protein n=1 Tax=Dipteronia sinensis TaxID=43782 RepID=A0AAE0E696_9ROSI|nr:hypothetical protein Dsin_015734 [Dipteronia sinensis]